MREDLGRWDRTGRLGAYGAHTCTLLWCWVLGVDQLGVWEATLPCLSHAVSTEAEGGVQGWGVRPHFVCVSPWATWHSGDRLSHLPTQNQSGKLTCTWPPSWPATGEEFLWTCAPARPLDSSDPGKKEITHLNPWCFCVLFCKGGPLVLCFEHMDSTGRELQAGWFRESQAGGLKVRKRGETARGRLPNGVR